MVSKLKTIAKLIITRRLDDILNINLGATCWLNWSKENFCLNGIYELDRSNYLLSTIRKKKIVFERNDSRYNARNSNHFSSYLNWN